ncbi:membrane protein [Staphylococcus gallinarum]|uniref:Membrane protein n=1 Tax=Staphylococcus gallinarum TaxID=1293 RepID=A0A380FLB9_STAGA|nr:membrane protein [Staphylococcus gallinarum]
MNKRYVKVLFLYSFSTLIPTLLLNEKCMSNHGFKWFTRTLAGYGIFAYGFKGFKQI